jgi:hypothetical protein
MNWNIIESGIKHHNLHQWNLGSQYDKLVIVESGVKHPLPLFAMQGLFRPTIFQSYTTFCQSHFMTFICQHLSVPCSNSSVLLTVLSGVNNILIFPETILFIRHTYYCGICQKIRCIESNTTGHYTIYIQSNLHMQSPLLSSYLY